MAGENSLAFNIVAAPPQDGRMVDTLFSFTEAGCSAGKIITKAMVTKAIP